ncbi:arylesterase [Mucilaginibacter ginkgonis]|uniref:Arylesterase n=1 Tax=Mucilaginibacter ginkgonis TaxID=2682091 RepID=A0A6I4I086_9SPHI|nr:arylesterase [Mucilaginibacter ginkgonis]QQL49848.1 arylesterase [Mucilaginibacter ginkgonis]
MNKTKIYLAFACALLAFSCSNPPKVKDTDDTSYVKRKAPSATGRKTILVFGDSLTAGYGLDDPSAAYPGVLQHYIDSLKLNYTVVNSGVSGETTAGGRSRIDWVLKTEPDIFLLELGANDGLRGTTVTETIHNLQTIIDKVKAKYPDTKIILLGMQVPPSMGQKYVGDFKKLFPDLAEKNHIDLVPFLLQGVGGDPKLNQADGIHPNVAGAKILAANVWQVLKKEI